TIVLAFAIFRQGMGRWLSAAGAVALDHYDHADIAAMRDLYRQRRDAIVPGLIAAGCEVEAPKAGFFVWARTPSGPDGRPISSMTYAARLLQEADMVVVPGAGFSSLPGGGGGKDYIRIALTVEADRMRQAAGRLKNLRH
ncbi:MAG: aminotransferase class I/II-fold pyridoxal phosphate-dependent enzyme, partial [Phycisphaerales bacterium]|nr:aminotransferase class I/II-fold pyridoxal phosphate-dependent enzyme [Phycisphaerales bacterium]